MTIFITGATGYIGSVVAETLQRYGYDVLGLAHSDAAARSLQERGLQILRGGLADLDVLHAGAAQADGVIHLAAAGSGDTAALDAAATRAMLAAVDGTAKPFVYTSGVWVLGKTGTTVADETAPANPTPLVAWRASLEREVLNAGARGIVLRPGIVYGRDGGIPAMLVASGRERGAVRFVGTGDQHWPFVHVEDLAELYVRALDAPAGTLLHGVTEAGVRVREVAAAASHAAGVDERVQAWPVEEARAELGAFADALALDQRVASTTAQQLLGWEPRHASVLEELRSGSYVPHPTPQHYVCTTCGTQFAATDAPPSHCPICEDERQYIGWQGQQWTTLEALRADHRNVIRAVEPGLTEIYTQPSFAIGQRALLVETGAGNVLWDCITLLDDATIEAIRAKGGLSAIAISHPHYYSAVVAWSRAFGGVPIYLHAADRAWVVRPDEAMVFWEGDTQALPGGLTLIRVGGHFPGSTVLHWSEGAAGRGALLTGDSIKVAQDRRHVSFMWSFPNQVPLAADDVRTIAEAVVPYAFDRIYGAWPGHEVRTGAKASVERSARRYLDALEGYYADADTLTSAS